MQSQGVFPIDQDDLESEDRLREMTKLLGGLFIARRDVKAWEYEPPRKGWYPDRYKFLLKDFRDHFGGFECLGTYLLDVDNNVKFLAFDIDLQRECPYYALSIGGELDLEPSVGDLEGALHGPPGPAKAWARIILLTTISQVQHAVENVLGLKTLNVVTGGGAHVFVPFGDLLPAKEARALGTLVMGAMNHWEQKNENFWIPERIHPDPPGEHPDWTHYSRTIEVFPKQDEIKNADGLGNLIRLPFGVHKKTGVQTFALADCDYDDMGVEFHKQYTLESLRGIAESLGMKV